MDWRLVVGSVGAVLTLFGVASLFVPALLGLWPGQQGGVDPATSPMTFVWPAVVVAVVAVLVVRAGAVGARQVSDSPAAGRFAGDSPASTTDEPRVAAGTLDADLDRAVRRGGASLTAVRSLLRSTAVSAHAEAAGVPRERAERAVERGEWTDDRVAAQFLAESDESAALSRVWLWLVPVRERRRRIERTIAAIECLQEDR
jgi:hypothetical protein